MEYDDLKVGEWIHQEYQLRASLAARSKQIAELQAANVKDNEALTKCERDRLKYQGQFVEVKRTRHNAATTRPKTPTASDKRLAQAAMDTLGIPYDEALKMAMRG